MAETIAGAPQDQEIPLRDTFEPQNQKQGESTDHQKSSNLLKLGAGVVVTILISITAYLGYQNWQLRQQISPDKPTPMPQVSVTPTPDPTADWKTYTNTFYKFEVKYPPSWIGPGRASGTMEQGTVSFFGSENNSGNSVSLETGGGFGGGPCPTKPIIVTSAAGNLGFCVIPSPNNGSEVFKTANEGPWPSQASAIHFSAEAYPPNATNEALIKQILSTFKFTNTVTADLQTFNLQGVEFMYPTSYTVQPAPGTNLVMSSWGGNSGFGVAKTTSAHSGNYNLSSIFTSSRTQFYSKTKSADDTAEQCFVSSDSRIKFSDSVTINGIVFKKSPQFGGAAAGAATQQIAYRTVHSGYCWDITLTNVTSSDWNNVDKNETNTLEETSWKELNQILSSFKFTN